MIQRCNNPHNRAYKHYGSRGITVCKTWLKFENFLSDMGECPSGLTLDRINNNGNYNKKNCRWTTRKTQARNRRTSKMITIDNVTKCLKEWCESLCLDYNKVKARINQLKWPIKQALEIE